MKKQTAITSIFLITLCIGAGTVFAQTSVDTSASLEAETNSGGGLGKGINSMVRSILGETEESAALYSAPTPEPSLMMQMNAAADQSAEARMVPEAATMSMKAGFAADTIIPMSKIELSDYIHDLLIQDSNVQSVDSSDTHVRLTYAVPSKVFRVVRVTMRVTVSATISGKTEVTYPWYAFASSAAVAELKSDVRERVLPLIPSEPFTPDEQRVLIDELHLALAAKFGSSTGGDR